ncbi:hypothetical protein KPL71_001183 [Citrus sinensis]|uniref:Uncharacterized protein n=1 Tax=Citrus sinensis TaxID=2711 RepID=A0ACB8NVG5_CITSI|nr:hypothetical protein KPL71_001183 [Citrus sinensis]
MNQDPHPNLPKLTRPLNPPMLTEPLKHHQGQDTDEIVLVPLAVVPTVVVKDILDFIVNDSWVRGRHTFKIVDLSDRCCSFFLHHEMGENHSSSVQMYHNTSSVVSLDGSRVKPVRNRFSRWKEENGKGSVTRQYDPSKLFGMTHTLFRDNPFPPPSKPKPKPKPQPRPVILHPSSISIPGQHSPGHTPASPPVPPPSTESQPPSQSKDKQPMHQFSAHTVAHSPTTDDQTSDSNLAVSDSHTETDTESSVSTSDSEKSYADITRILMVQPDQLPQGQTSHTEPYVDIPSDIDQEMPESSATNQPPPAQAQTSPPNQKSSNGPWFTFDDLPSHNGVIALMKCLPGLTFKCYVQAPQLNQSLENLLLVLRDLDFHYKRMSLLFYKLNGFNEPTLKHAFLASLPDELQPDIQRQLTASNLVLDNISLGKIFQLAKTCLDKLWEQKQFFKELLKDKEPFRSACKKPYLQIKCKKKKDCDCSPKKKRHFKKFRNPEFSSRPRRSRKPYRFFRKKSSSSRDFKRRKSCRCFICKKKGHYAKDCPNKLEKSIRLVEHLQATTDYSPEKDGLEFYFSEQDEPNDETMPILAIGLIDTGAQRSMLNPHLLPPKYWTDYEEHFKAVNGKLFTTSLITKKPIGIQIFPNCVIWTKVIGSTLPNKDLLLGFDILHQIKHLQILPNGIRVKSMFKPFTDILKLYNLSETPQPYQDISNKLLSFYPESHSKFTHPNPIWKRSHDEHRQLLTQFYDIVQSHGIELTADDVHHGILKKVYEWFTAPHLAVIENEIQDVLYNYLCQLNHQPLPLKDIFHTSLGPQHDLLMIPTPSAISNPKSTGIITKEERPDYTDFLYQDSQDPWENFLPLSQHLQQVLQPSMNEPGSSSQPPKVDTATKPSKVDKATQTSPRPGY